MHDNLDEQLTVRVPGWLKAAIETRAKERREKGERTTPSDVAREVLWPVFAQSRTVNEPARDAEVVTA